MNRRPRAMRILAAAVVTAAAAAAATGCQQDLTSTPGDPVAGAAVLRETDVRPTCGHCHSLAAAGFTGRIGPDLDVRQPGYGTVLRAMREGPGTMPSFEDDFSERELHDIAAYISGAAPP